MMFYLGKFLGEVRERLAVAVLKDSSFISVFETRSGTTRVLGLSPAVSFQQCHLELTL